jgi:hypothetical protein
LGLNAVFPPEADKLGPKLSKNCMNLMKKLLPAGCLTIIIISLFVRINGYRGQFEGVKNGFDRMSEQCSAGD